jgi:NADPH:quinone reductase-like Zn-dependent oxidoreductase
VETRTPGSASGPQKRTGGNTGTALRADSTNKVRVVIEQTYPFDKAASAVAHVLEHHASGKVATAV